MNKKVNIITNGSTLAIVLALIAHFHYSKNAAALALIGIVIMAWFIVVFRSHRKSHRKKNVNTRE